MKIRCAKKSEIDSIMKIYERAAQFMRETGNPNQWINGYPQRELILQDIEKGASYVLETEDGIEAAFAFFIGEDLTYRRIEGGSWLNDREYATIHRLASAGRKKKTAQTCFAWCASQCLNLRADTHHDNRIMQHILEKNGFIRCGIIYVRNNDTRIAYHRVCSN